jgi:hypothetical protein
LGPAPEVEPLPPELAHSAISGPEPALAATASAPPSAHSPGFMSVPQRRYLARGLKQPGGKLPRFDEDGQEVSHRTIEACLAHGWAEPWTRNPVMPHWYVCRLTAAGYRALGMPPPEAGTGT